MKAKQSLLRPYKLFLKEELSERYFLMKASPGIQFLEVVFEKIKL